MTSFEKLEALNVEIARQATGNCKGIPEALRANYRAILIARQDDVRKAITEARADTQRYVFGRVSPHHYIDGIAAELTRALIEHHKRIMTRTTRKPDQPWLTAEQAKAIADTLRKQ